MAGTAAPRRRGWRPRFVLGRDDTGEGLEGVLRHGGFWEKEDPFPFFSRFEKGSNMRQPSQRALLHVTWGKSCHVMSQEPEIIPLCE